jgi:hypothetical protein
MQRDRTIDRPVEMDGIVLVPGQAEEPGSVSVAVAAASNGVVSVAGIESSVVARPETNYAGRMSQLGLDDACNTVPGRLDFLLKPTSTCLDYSEASLGNVSPLVAVEFGTFEGELGLCSKSLLPGCSALPRSTKHGLEYSGLCESSVGDEVAPGLGD